MLISLRSLPAFAACTVLALTALRVAPATALAVPGPVVGVVAPEPGLRGWIQREGTPGVTLAELRGRVVVLHTFAWNCSSCRKVGLPLATDLQAANADRALSVLSITTPAYPDETREVLAEFGVAHPVATENPFGSDNPYVDASVNPITYMFVIGRDGDLVWRGDPSTKSDEFMEAVARALAQPVGDGLDRPLDAALDPAVQLYFGGEWDKARKAATKLAEKHRRAKRADGQRIAADANQLLERIDGRAQALVADLETALEARDPLSIARARELLLSRAPKSQAAERAEALLERLDADAELSQQVEAAVEWLELAAARPALFPVRAERAEQGFAKDLRRFVDRNPDSPFRPDAERWLARWDELRGGE